MKRISIAAGGIVLLSANKKEGQFTLSICTGSDKQTPIKWLPWNVVRNRMGEAPGYPSGPEIFYKPSISTDFPRFTTSFGAMILQPAMLQEPGYFSAVWSAARFEALTRIIPGYFIPRHQS